MERMLFINLAVDDLPAALVFYERIGAVRNRQFADDSCAMVSFSHCINVILMTHERLRTMTARPIAPRGMSEVLLCLSSESRGAVDALAAAAAEAGGELDPCVVQDHGYMYSRSFTDLDGHVWETVWMDPSVAQSGSETA